MRTLFSTHISTTTDANRSFKSTMTKYLAIAFLITGFLVGDAYGDEDEVFYCPKVILLGLPKVLAVLHFAFPYLEKHRLVVQELIA